MGSASTALQALESVAAAQPMGVSELARRLGVSKPAAQRALQSLAESGWIRRSDDQPGRWVLTVKVVAVAAEVGSEFGLREVARPAMRALVDSTGEAVHISVLDGLDVVTIDQVDSTQVLRIHWSTGARSPAYAAASGKAMLTVMPADERNRHLPAELDGITTHTITSRDAFDRELDEIAARGYALQRGELRDDVASVAAPILARPGHPVAAISVFMPAHRFPEGGGSSRSSPRRPRRSPQGWPSGHEPLGIALTAQKRCPTKHSPRLRLSAPWLMNADAWAPHRKAWLRHIPHA